MSPYDQLNVIFDVIGSPTTDEIERVHDEGARKYLRQLETRGGTKAQDIGALFPGASNASIDLLKRMIAFDPDKRITIEEVSSSSLYPRDTEGCSTFLIE